MSHLDRTTPMLDLHGLQKEDAIKAATRFLEIHENSGSFVIIITGSGSHSPNGPVLRSAVDNMLRRRMMEYEQDKPGSFRIRSGTGVVYYQEASCEIDSKVIVQERDGDEFDLRNAINRSRAKRSGRSLLLPPPRDHLIGPTLAQVASNEALFARAREESLDLHRETRKYYSLERNELDLAKEVSMRQLKTEEEDEEKELHQSMKASLETSEMEAAVEMSQENAMIQKALEQSMLESTQIQSRQLLVEKALDQSLQEAMNRSLLETESSVEEEEEERLVQEVLRLSMIS